MLAVHPLVLAQIGLVSALGTAHLPGMFRVELPARQVLCRFRAAMTGPFPDDVGYVAVYSRSDGIVQWRSCLDPEADELRRGQRLALRHGRQRPGLPRRRDAMARFERNADPLLRTTSPTATRSGRRREPA